MDNKKHPKISIVTPSYNQAEFLETTILSVINQDYSNLEYIIIDGGSNDGSVDIIKKYEKYLTYWVSEKDNGQADAIRKGFEIASGDILGWLNSDDIYLAHTLSKVAKAFENNPDCDVIYGNQIVIDENNNAIGEKRYVPVTLKALAFESSIGQPNVFWSKNIYDKVGGIDTSFEFCMDLDLFVRMAKVGKLSHLNDYLAAFRSHSKTKTSNLKNVHDKDKDYIQKIHFNELNGASWMNAFYLFRRFVMYIIQSDFDYLLKGFVRRIMNKKQQKTSKKVENLVSWID